MTFNISEVAYFQYILVNCFVRFRSNSAKEPGCGWWDSLRKRTGLWLVGFAPPSLRAGYHAGSLKMVHWTILLTLPFESQYVNKKGLPSWETFSIDGVGGIRTHVPRRANAFRVRPVMTTSIQLQITIYMIILYKKSLSIVVWFDVCHYNTVRRINQL